MPKYLPFFVLLTMLIHYWSCESTSKVISYTLLLVPYVVLLLGISTLT